MMLSEMVSKVRAMPWLLVIAGLLAVPARGETVAGLVNAGNRLFEKGAFDQALAEYQQAAEAADTPSAVILHNLARTHLALGDREAAEALWRDAAKSNDHHVASRARFNLGTLRYQRALEQRAAGAIQAASSAIDIAIRDFRQAIALQPQFDDARANLELAYRLRRELQAAAAAEQSQAPSESSAAEDEQDERDENAARDRRDEDGAGDQSEESDGQEQSDAEAEDASTSLANRQAPQQATPPEDGAQPGDAAEAQTPNEPSSGQMSPPDASTQPAPEPSPANDGPIDPASLREEPDATQPVEGAPLTSQQIQRLLQLVRDRDRARREYLRAVERLQAQQQKPTPVEKDW
jgi:tetratricopeptide (TPR) repeat protein